MGVVRDLTHNPLIEQGKFINFRKLCNKTTIIRMHCTIYYHQLLDILYIYMELRIVIFRYSSAQLYFGNSEMRGIK